MIPAISSPGLKPLDHPYPERPRRLYFAITNHCNRSCPWCSTCSSPRGTAFMSLETFESLIPEVEPFEAQLEGGEPTVHPQFLDFARLLRVRRNCSRVVICTNGVLLPRQRNSLENLIATLGSPLTLKLSVNHHLLDGDPGLLDLARELANLADDSPRGLSLVLNVRLRPGIDADEALLVAAIRHAGLMDRANFFFLQAYGFARGMPWMKPAPVWDNFLLFNPDGRSHGTDLVARSEAMRLLGKNG